ncbi:MAG: thermonuclease family protein, partial [Planctomycetales bacterium]|nr:thermonuclease family protein [Planctomycetales bacterium]
IDTPETVKEGTPVQPWGPEATEYTKQFVRDAGGRIRVEVDGEYADQYGRRLIFVWYGDRLLNEELVRQGLARPKLAYDYSQGKKDLLKRAQREAQSAGRGIWSH